MAAGIGTPPHIISALVNHVTEGLTPIQRVYNRHSYQPEMLKAVLAIEAYLASLIS